MSYGRFRMQISQGSKTIQADMLITALRVYYTSHSQCQGKDIIERYVRGMAL